MPAISPCRISPAVGAGDYRDWLSALDPAAPLSLYLHVPYCQALCWYCGCNMKLVARYGPVAAYLETLLREIDLLTEALPAGMRVSHLHWSGGALTVLMPDDLARAMDRLRRRFTILPDAELAIESDPRSLTPEMAERIGALGFTRASFGVQEFDPREQPAINRVQPPEMVADCVAALRRAGVGGINFDLIYGLPHQSVQTLRRTIARTSEIGSDRIALFGYAHVPWMAKKPRRIDAEARPGADGHLRRNFQGYATDRAETLLGLSVTSIGRTPGGFVQNLVETGAWKGAIEEGRLPIAKGHWLSRYDRLRAAAFDAYRRGSAARHSLAV